MAQDDDTLPGQDDDEMPDQGDVETPDPDPDPYLNPGHGHKRIDRPSVDKPSKGGGFPPFISPGQRSR